LAPQSIVVLNIVDYARKKEHKIDYTYGHN